MIKLIIITALMTSFFDVVLKKHGFYDTLHKWATNQNSKFIYRLSSCQFCIRFYLGVISFVLVTFLGLFNIEYILTPFCVAGLFKIINYDSRA